MTGECFRCGSPATTTFGNGFICDDCTPDGDSSTPTTESESEPSDDYEQRWDAADFTSPESDVWPLELLEREQWMGHVEKKPFAPWGDRDHPEADEDEDARWKWGLRENYADGETVAIAEDDPRLDGRAFLQREDDPFAYVDGDDVRDPETGEVHPAFVGVLNRLGLTYGDVSQSGAGVHAQYRGELPEGVKQAKWQLDDEPFGSNDDLPSVEIYAGKRVCVATGEHIPGTPTEIREWDDEALYDLLESNDQLPAEPNPVEREDYDLDDYEPSATASDETTDDIRDIFKALDRLDARHVAEKTIVHRWNDEATTSDGHRAFYPTWGSTSDNGTANVVDENRWLDTGDRGGYGGPVVMALIDAGEISDRNASPAETRGENFFKGVEHLRELGFDIPEYESSAESEPRAPIPLERLRHLNRDEAKRYAKKHGRDWPSTKEARRRLEREVHDALRSESTIVIDAPTALGKSYTVSTTPWLNRQDIAGGAPVVMFHETREVRDSAAEDSNEANVAHRVLKGRSEACAVAAGHHDPAEDDEEDPDQIITMKGMPASEWFTAMCDGRGVPFSTAHAYLREHNDQQTDLPCQEDGECHAIAQWEGIPRDDDGENALDIIHATHQFAHVPGLQQHTNMVFDERPDFTADLSHDQIRRAVTAYLQESGAPVTTYEGLVTRARKDEEEVTPNEHAQHPYVSQALDHEPDREWYLEADGAHTLAPALTRGVWYAIRDGADQNGRFSSTVPHEPPRLDAEAHEDSGWNREYVTVVVDEENTVRKVRTAPDLSQARAVVGLDAHPAMTLWQRNVHPGIKIQPVLGVEERQLWRLFERGLLVAQVGDAVRPYASGEYFNENTSRAFIQALRDEFGEEFGTAITASSVESRYQQLMEQAGIPEPATMHYGEEKSRDDFADENVGAVDGSIDPGDDYVLDILAEAGLDAIPETSTDEDGEEHRARGRGFEGTDAELAEEILASVREQHVAQAAGRYARNADEPEDTAIVFVRTSAMPAGFADVQVPGVEWLPTDAQQQIVEELQQRESATAKELSEATGVSKQWVAETLARLRDDGLADCRESAGEWGADLYSALAGVDVGTAGVDLQGGAEWITNGHVWGSYTWSLAIADADTGQSALAASPGGGNWGETPANGSSDEGDPPS